MGVTIDMSPPAEWYDDEPPERDDETQGADLHSRLVRDELRKLRARETARGILAAERQPPAQPFDAGTLAEVLARPGEPAHRVEGLIPWQGSTLVAAQRKTGKTTSVLNLARSLITGEPFLGSCATRAVLGRVCLLNYEVSGAQVARWADEVGVPDGRLFLVNLRGRRNPLAHAEDRRTLAELLRAQEVETLIVDPFGRAYTGTSQNDAGEVGAWLVDLDTFARAEVGALDLVLTAHAGWNAERTRGSSALEDWADSIITLTRDETTGERFLRATGRDVDHDEDRLDYDPDTRRLTLAGAGSRKQTAAARHIEGLISEVVRVVTAQPGANGSKVEERLKADGVPGQKGDARKALAAAVERGMLRMEPGKGPAKLYYPELPHNYPGGSSTTTPTPPYRGGVVEGAVTATNYPDHLDDRGLCRLHHAQPAAGCYTCDALTGELQ